MATWDTEGYNEEALVGVANFLDMRGLGWLDGSPKH